MKKLFLDIETLPADIENLEVLGKINQLYERYSEKVYKKMYDKADELTFDDFVTQTSFDGAFGRILCIALAVNDDEVKCYSSDDVGVWNEKKTLENFWMVAGQCDLFIGHNIFDFDMRFIYQRSIILGVKPSKDLSFVKYRNSPMFDTMQEWTKWGWNGKLGLEHIALAMNIPSPKDGIDGSQVADFYKKGEIVKICDYCKRDVETTRAIYKKMTFQ